MTTSQPDALTRKCPKARVKSGRKAKLPVPHGPHDWIAGVYFPAGDIDGYPARCPGYYVGVPLHGAHHEQ